MKTADDKLLDVLPLPADCEHKTEMTKLSAFPGRDSIKLACWRTGGADRTRHDLFIDFDGTSLAIAASSVAGTEWIQLEEDKEPRCSAKPPGEMVVAKKGTEPQLAVSDPATPEDGAAAKVEIVPPGGCETTIATCRMTYDPKARRFVGSGTPVLSLRKKLCVCRK